MVDELGADRIGDCGLSNVGAVTGATRPGAARAAARADAARDLPAAGRRRAGRGRRGAGRGVRAAPGGRARVRLALDRGRRGRCGGRRWSCAAPLGRSLADWHYAVATPYHSRSRWTVDAAVLRACWRRSRSSPSCSRCSSSSRPRARTNPSEGGRASRRRRPQRTRPPANDDDQRADRPGNFYTVKTGDTLGAIAEEIGVPWRSCRSSTRSSTRRRWSPARR